MNFGIETKNKQCFCKNCGKELKIEVPNQIFNFCPFCSSPLNLVAYNLKIEQEKNIKYDVVKDLVKFSKNKSTLIDLKAYLEKISEE